MEICERKKEIRCKFQKELEQLRERNPKILGEAIPTGRMITSKCVWSYMQALGQDEEAENVSMRC